MEFYCPALFFKLQGSIFLEILYHSGYKCFLIKNVTHTYIPKKFQDFYTNI